MVGDNTTPPDHWATYYIMTLYNLGAFSEEFLQTMDPDRPARRRDVFNWTVALMKSGRPDLAVNPQNEDAPLTRAELAGFTVNLMRNERLRRTVMRAGY